MSRRLDSQDGVFDGEASASVAKTHDHDATFTPMVRTHSGTEKQENEVDGTFL